MDRFAYGGSRVAGQVAAVDGEDRARNHGRRVGNEKGDGAGHVIGRRQPAQRDASQYALAEVRAGRVVPGQQVVHRRGVDLAGLDRVDANAETTPFEGEFPNELVDPSLRDAVSKVSSPHCRPRACRTRHHDRAANASLYHLAANGLGHEEIAGQVELEDGGPLVITEVFGESVGAAAGVVDENVDL